MPTIWRIVRPVVLVAVVLTLVFPLALTSYAQDGGEPTPVVIQGTPELEGLVSAIRDAYQAAYPDLKVEIDPRGGLNGGFDALCSGDVDIVMSTQPIEDLQVQTCTSRGQDFIETVLAYETVVLVAAPEAAVTCVDEGAINEAWQLGAEAEISWTALGSELDQPVAFYGPNDLSPTTLLFGNMVPAGELRDDITALETPEDLIAKVQEEGSNAFAFMSLVDWQNTAGDNPVMPVAIRTEQGDCIVPSPSTVAAGTYPYARTDYLYINAESAQSTEVRSFFQFALADEAGVTALAAGLGYTPADSATYELSLNYILDGNTGRTFTRPLTPVTVSTSEAGQVSVVGSSMLYSLTKTVKDEFESLFPNASVEIVPMGDSAGWQMFCSGAADVLQTTREATEDELALCAENGIESFLLDLGTQAQVVVVPAGADWIECLTPGEFAAIFRAGTDEEPSAALWSDVNAEWPENPLLLVTPPLSTGETDYLAFSMLHDLTFAVRLDTVEKNDPLYRAQGVANTDNGLSYLWWTDLQKSSAEVKLLAIDTGDGCVEPDVEAFMDGTYPLSYPVRYYFSQQAFSVPLVRAFLWNFFSDTALDAITRTPYVGLDVEAQRTDVRDAVYELLAEVEAQAMAEAEAAGAEATPEATLEATPEATEEGTPEATVEPTVEPTVEATAEATVEPTAEATAEATAEGGS